MHNGPEIERLSLAFVAEAENLEPSAPIASVSWPTVGAMVDHLGSIQRWATAVIQTGRAARVEDHDRPAGRDPLDWFREGARELCDVVGRADPDSACWTFVGPGQARFWGRRMVHEATKHLWDVRTATTPDPPMPPEVADGTPTAIIDEFTEVFIPRARRRGIDPLPGSVLLLPRDSDRSWRIEPDWQVVQDGAGDASAVLRATVADLALVLWERADPWRLPARYGREGDEAVLHGLVDARIHL